MWGPWGRGGRFEDLRPSPHRQSKRIRTGPHFINRKRNHPKLLAAHPLEGHQNHQRVRSAARRKRIQVTDRLAKKRVLGQKVRLGPRRGHMMTRLKQRMVVISHRNQSRKFPRAGNLCLLILIFLFRVTTSQEALEYS